jgi:hypothetical protein
MAINAYKTLSVTNLDATPILRANPWVHGGHAKQFAGTVEAVNGDSAASTYRFFRIGSWMRPVSLTLFCDALTGGAADLGLYRTASDGGAVVSGPGQTLFASAQSIATANAAGINVRFEQDDIANVEKRIWELLALTADPNLEYDVALTLTAPISASGTLALQGVFSW